MVRSARTLPVLAALALALPALAPAGIFPDDLPIKWELPEGWNCTAIPAAGGGRILALSGDTPDVYARAWTWIAPGGTVTPVDARRRLDSELGPGWTLARTVARQQYDEVTFVGSSTGEIDQRKVDRILVARVGVVGGELVAAGVFVPHRGGLAAQDQVARILAGSSFAPASRPVDSFGNVLLAWDPEPSVPGQVPE